MTWRRPTLWLGVALLVGIFLGLYSQSRAHLGDADRYYHIALSRLMVETNTFIPRELPQVEDLGWGRYFPDKEFLYHQFTRLGYLVAGERGVIGVSLLLAIASILYFFISAANQVPVVFALILTFVTMFDPLIFFRLTLVRPHVLAMLLFIVLLDSALKKRILVTGLAGLLFALAYHAFYVPVGCLALLLLIVIAFRDRAETVVWIKTAVSGVAGCAVGVLVNPYFPSNIHMAVIHAKIPSLVQGPANPLQFGSELLPLQSNQFLLFFYLPMIIIFLGGFLFGREKVAAPQDTISRDRQTRFLFLLSATVYFFSLTFITYRAAEYLFPCLGFLAVTMISQPGNWRKELRYGLAAVLIIQALVFGKLFLMEYRSSAREALDQSTFAAISRIPLKASGAKVFNCEWDRAPMIFYSRPDLRFVDILDPSLLFFGNYPAFAALTEMRKGLVSDLYGMLHGAFHADYMLCRDPGIVSQASNDPHFEQIFPALGSGTGGGEKGVYLFRLKNEVSERFIEKIDVKFLGTLTPKEIAEFSPKKEMELVSSSDLSKSRYLNLALLYDRERSALRDNALGTGIPCAVLAPNREQLERYVGAEKMGIGGGPGFMVWRNGTPLFRSAEGALKATSVQASVPLNPPLGKNEKIDLLLCNPGDARFWGLMLSFWKRNELEELCLSKKGHSVNPSKKWTYRAGSESDCLGPQAVSAQ